MNEVDQQDFSLFSKLMEVMHIKSLQMILGGLDETECSLNNISQYQNNDTKN